jgi:CheY-like chemotaxis protein
MDSEKNQPASPPSPILDSTGFEARVTQEAARVRRSGGFLSLAMLAAGNGARTEDQSQVLARKLQLGVRLHDVLGRSGVMVGVLMPDATIAQAAQAAERFVTLCAGVLGSEAKPAAGVATMYGSVEGGAAALLGAAADALEGAAPGNVARSRDLNGRPRILVVDDDVGFATALAETIGEGDWDADPCSDNVDARNRVGVPGYAALFVDLVMPGTNGVELVRRWLTVRPIRPAILMSGHDAQHQAILEALSLGPVMFVGKPVVKQDLETALDMCRQLLPGAAARR